MHIDQEYFKALKEISNATDCAVLKVKDIVLDPGLRRNCELNYCGEFGRTWVCPPHCGTIEDCIAKVSGYDYAVVVEYVGELEDSYDFEGMQKAARDFQHVFLKAVEKIKEDLIHKNHIKEPDILCLGAGGCHRCETCSLSEEKPCRFPLEAFPSLESHGIFVSDLAGKAGLNYINGKNTVTYFGAVFLNKSCGEIVFP